MTPSLIDIDLAPENQELLIIDFLRKHHFAILCYKRVMMSRLIKQIYGSSSPMSIDELKKTEKIVPRRPGASVFFFSIAENGDVCRYSGWPQSSEMAMRPDKSHRASLYLVVVDSLAMRPRPPALAGMFFNVFYAANINTISGLACFASLPHPPPYDYKKIRRDFLASAGSRVVPVWVPPNVLKTFIKSGSGTLELWNRIFSYARAPTRIYLWFQSSKVPYSYNVNKNKELSGTQSGTAVLLAVPYSQNRLNRGCLLYER